MKYIIIEDPSGIPPDEGEWKAQKAEREDAARSVQGLQATTLCMCDWLAHIGEEMIALSSGKQTLENVDWNALHYLLEEARLIRAAVVEAQDIASAEPF